MTRTSLLLLLCLGLGALVTGCGDKAADAPKTPQEVKDFKGGPPPPEAQAKIREMMQKGKGPAGGPPPGVPGAGGAPPPGVPGAAPR